MEQHFGLGTLITGFPDLAASANLSFTCMLEASRRNDRGFVVTFNQEQSVVFKCAEQTELEAMEWETDWRTRTTKGQDNTR